MSRTQLQLHGLEILVFTFAHHNLIAVVQYGRKVLVEDVCVEPHRITRGIAIGVRFKGNSSAPSEKTGKSHKLDRRLPEFLVMATTDRFSQTPKQLRADEHRFARAITLPGDQRVRPPENLLPSQGNEDVGPGLGRYRRGVIKRRHLSPKLARKVFFDPEGCDLPREALLGGRSNDIVRNPLPNASLDIHR